MWVSISAGRHLNNCPPRVVDASTNLCQCLLQFTFSKLIVMTMMMNISEYLLDCCCPYVLFIHFWSTAKYSPNLIVFHFAGTFSKLTHTRWDTVCQYSSGGGRLPWKEKIWKPEWQSIHGAYMPCFGSRWKMEPTLRGAVTHAPPGHPNTAQSVHCAP